MSTHNVDFSPTIEPISTGVSHRGRDQWTASGSGTCNDCSSIDDHGVDSRSFRLAPCILPKSIMSHHSMTVLFEHSKSDLWTRSMETRIMRYTSGQIDDSRLGQVGDSRCGQIDESRRDSRCGQIDESWRDSCYTQANLNAEPVYADLNDVLRLRGGMQTKKSRNNNNQEAAPVDSGSEGSTPPTDRNRKTPAKSSSKEVERRVQIQVENAHTQMDGVEAEEGEWNEVQSDQSKKDDKKAAAMAAGAQRGQGNGKGNKQKGRQVDPDRVVIVDKIPENRYNSGDIGEVVLEIYRIAPTAKFFQPMVMNGGGVKIIFKDKPSAVAFRSSDAWGKDAFGAAETIQHPPGGERSMFRKVEGQSVIELNKLIVENVPKSWTNDRLAQHLRDNGHVSVKKVIEFGNKKRMIEFLTVEAATTARNEGITLFGMQVSKPHYCKSVIENKPCGNCLKAGHGPRTCPNPTRCRACLEDGHKMGDMACTKRTGTVTYVCSLCQGDHITGYLGCQELKKARKETYAAMVAAKEEDKKKKADEKKQRQLQSANRAEPRSASKRAGGNAAARGQQGAGAPLPKQNGATAHSQQAVQQQHGQTTHSQRGGSQQHHGKATHSQQGGSQQRHGQATHSQRGGSQQQQNNRAPVLERPRAAGYSENLPPMSPIHEQRNRSIDAEAIKRHLDRILDERIDNRVMNKLVVMQQDYVCRTSEVIISTLMALAQNKRPEMAMKIVFDCFRKAYGELLNFDEIEATYNERIATVVPATDATLEHDN